MFKMFYHLNYALNVTYAIDGIGTFKGNGLGHAPSSGRSRAAGDTQYDHLRLHSLFCAEEGI